MWPQIEGEALNLASVLIWGPSYYHQSRSTGKDHPKSKPNQLMRYDLEISGFPSSHAGHLVLLGVKDQLPGNEGSGRLADVGPSNPEMGKGAGVSSPVSRIRAGASRSEFGLPNYEMPGFDGIGANEYIVDVTHLNTVDFISAGDTPAVWELNIWHTLNTGFRTRISGETDFRASPGDRIGLARSYCKVDGPLTCEKWIQSVQRGRSYVSDGRSHLFDFSVNGTAAGTGESEVALAQPGRVKVTLRAAAKLDAQPLESIRQLRYDEKPYWDLERARIGSSNEVPVEILVNGVPVARQTLVADGTSRPLTFDVPIERSSWIAARILPSSHTNPVFAIVGGKPVRASRRSAEWCLNAVNQCWTQKASRSDRASWKSPESLRSRARDLPATGS